MRLSVKLRDKDGTLWDAEVDYINKRPPEYVVFCDHVFFYAGQLRYIEATSVQRVYHLIKEQT